MTSSSEQREIVILDTPDKSPFDKQQYRLIRLPNGIKCLLISPHDGTTPSGHTSTTTSITDEESADEYSAACAVGVDVGSYSDPLDACGMAHFLEHMLFLGSEKYPNENEINSYLPVAGGYSNAQTTETLTKYVMSARGKYLDASLDRFSQMFKTPLLSTDVIRREVNAVDSEFSLHMGDNSFRANRLMYSLGTENHPSTSFTWGTAQTLIGNRDEMVLQQKCRDFFRRHYSAHRMFLSINAALPLDRLQELAVRHFADIPSNDLPGHDLSAFTHLNAFQTKFHEKVFFLKSMNESKTISFNWCIEAQQKHYRTKPFKYLERVFNDEYAGGLFAFLSANDWSVASYANAELNESNVFGYFTIVIQLTDAGFQRLDHVIEATFAYLKFLKQMGPNERLYREYQSSANNKFVYATGRDSEFINSIVIPTNMQIFAPKDILNGADLFYEYDPVVIGQAIDQLNSKRFMVTVTSQQKYDENINFELKERWTGAEYSEMDWPDKWNSLWETTKPFTTFALPPPNTFMANDFTIFYDKSRPVPQCLTKILENDLCELWFRQDDKFLMPHAQCRFYFMTPNVMASPKNTTLLNIYGYLLRNLVAKKYSSIKLAEFEVTIGTLVKGLDIKVNGFNQHIHLVIDLITKEMRSVIDAVTDDKFRTAIGVYLRYLDTEHPSNVADRMIKYFTCDDNISGLEMKRMLRQIQLDDLTAFVRDMWKQMKIVAIIQGNLTEPMAQSIMQTVLTNVNCEKVIDQNSLKTHVLKLPAGAHCLRIKSTDPVNSFVQNYYQIGPQTLRASVLASLLDSIGTHLAYNVLRTEEQLGYVTIATTLNVCKVLAYSIYVQSNGMKYTTDHVDKRIDAFLIKLLTVIRALTDDEFEQHKTMLLTVVRSEPKTFHIDADRNCNEVLAEEYMFDRSIRVAQIISAISKTDLLEFYQNIVGADERKMSLQLVPMAHDDIDNENDIHYVSPADSQTATSINDIVEFKGKLEPF